MLYIVTVLDGFIIQKRIDRPSIRLCPQSIHITSEFRPPRGDDKGKGGITNDGRHHHRGVGDTKLIVHNPRDQ